MKTSPLDRPWERLPDTIAAGIVQLLHPATKLHLRLACRYFRHLVDSSVKRIKTTTFVAFHGLSLFNMHQRFPAVTRLTLNYTPLGFLAGNPKFLMQLRVVDIQLDPNDQEDLLDSVVACICLGCPSLERLTFNPRAGCTASNLCWSLQSLHHLQELDLSIMQDWLSDESLLVLGISNLTALTELRFCATSVQAQGFGCLGHLRSLNKLHLHRVTAHAWELMAAISQLGSLTSLYLLIEGAEALLPAQSWVPYPCSLRELSIDRDDEGELDARWLQGLQPLTSFSSLTLRHFGEDKPALGQLSNLTQLSKLHLTGPRLTDVDWLRYLHHLHSLHYNLQLLPEQAPGLATQFTMPAQLTSLDLFLWGPAAHCGMLLQQMSSLRQLQHLMITGYQCTEADVQGFARLGALTHLDINMPAHMPAMTSTPAFEKLDSIHAVIYKMHCQDLLDLCCMVSHVRSLRLDCISPNVTSKGFARALEQVRNLRTLYLYALDHLPDSAFVSICRLPLLANVTLDCCKAVTPCSVAALMVMCMLRTLRVVGCPRVPPDVFKELCSCHRREDLLPVEEMFEP